MSSSLLVPGRCSSAAEETSFCRTLIVLRHAETNTRRDLVFPDAESEAARDDALRDPGGAATGTSRCLLWAWSLSLS